MKLYVVNDRKLHEVDVCSKASLKHHLLNSNDLGDYGPKVAATIIQMPASSPQVEAKVYESVPNALFSKERSPHYP